MRLNALLDFLTFLESKGALLTIQLSSLSPFLLLLPVSEWHGGGTGENFSGSFLPFLCGGDSLVQRRHSSSSSLTEEMEPQFILMEYAILELISVCGESPEKYN